MRNLMISTMALLVAAVAAIGEDAYDDEMVKNSIHSMCTACGGCTDNDIDDLLSNRLNNDTNRLVRLAKEMSNVSGSNDVRRLIAIVGRYGTLDDLPFLYQQVSCHGPHSELALACALDKEGLTTNSFAVILGILATITNEPCAFADLDFASSRANTCRELLRYALARTPQDDLCNLARSVALDYARQDNREVVWLDDGFCRWYPGYLYSTNRLDVLRSVLALGVNEFQIGYVTNAIHEIEAQLPPE